MLVAAHDSKEVHPEGVQGAGVGRRVKLVADLWDASARETHGMEKEGGEEEGNKGHLFVVGTDEVEDKAAVHEGEQAVQKESQTAVQPLHELHVLQGRTLGRTGSGRKSFQIGFG